MRTRTLSSRLRESSSMVWKLSALSMASATWLATAASSSTSPWWKRSGSAAVTVRTPSTRSRTRSGVARKLLTS